MKYDYIPRDKRKKIFLLSDDLRTNSGIATMSRELVVGTAHHYNWIQLASLIKHQDKGKIIDCSQATDKEIGISDSSVKLFPWEGYGTQDIVREIMAKEKPDAILHFTDPRFWIFLYEMENEIRQHIPLTYLNIWDDVPYPMWNKPFYQSCDALFAISKQTYNINRFVLGDTTTSIKDLKDGKPLQNLVHYVPHGVNDKTFYPIKETDTDYAEYLLFKKDVLGGKNYEYVIFYNSRNIHRKHPADILVAYNQFCKSIGAEKAQKCVLLMHTQPIDEAGTDLVSVKNSLCLDQNVIFSHLRLEPKKMNYLYNISDVVINISSNEGFGISGVEGMMSGTPVILNVTGGLQDQLAFVDENDNPIEFTFDWGSNHDAKYTKCGKWGYPIFPSCRSIQGSVATPYIFDDRVKIEDIVDGFYYWYEAGEEIRKKAGLLGREHAVNNEYNSTYMAETFIEGMEATFKYWKPKGRFTLSKADKISVQSGGFKLKDIDKEKIKSRIESEWK